MIVLRVLETTTSTVCYAIPRHATVEVQHFVAAAEFPEMQHWCAVHLSLALIHPTLADT